MVCFHRTARSYCAAACALMCSHALSCALMRSHALSCALMRSHVLSCTLMRCPVFRYRSAAERFSVPDSAVREKRHSELSVYFTGVWGDCRKPYALHLHAPRIRF
jgi:hypothetical protein